MNYIIGACILLALSFCVLYMYFKIKSFKKNNLNYREKQVENEIVYQVQHLSDTELDDVVTAALSARKSRSKPDEPD